MKFPNWENQDTTFIFVFVVLLLLRRSSCADFIMLPSFPLILIPVLLVFCSPSGLLSSLPSSPACHKTSNSSQQQQHVMYMSMPMSMSISVPSEVGSSTASAVSSGTMQPSRDNKGTNANTTVSEGGGGCNCGNPTAPPQPTTDSSSISARVSTQPNYERGVNAKVRKLSCDTCGIGFAETFNSDKQK